MALENTWHHRRVADNASKACWICYKPSTSVLITPNNKPDAEEAAAVEARKKKEDLDREIEAVKKEYEEKQKLKREKRKSKDKDKNKEKDKDAKNREDEEDDKDEKAKDEKIKELSKSKDSSEASLGPRIYHLNKNFYQMRLDKIRNTEMARRNRERLNNPANFPSVPGGNP